MEGDHIRLFKDADLHNPLLSPQPWTGAWPPPERIGLLVGKKSRWPHRLVLGEEGEKEVREHVEVIEGQCFDEVFEIEWFVRKSHSLLSDKDMAEMSHVARGAAYYPEELHAHAE